MKLGRYSVIGFLLDLFDWMLIGMIPGIGDLADLVAAWFWTRKLGAVGLLSALELVPAVDVLPLNTVLGIAADNAASSNTHVRSLPS